MNKGPSLLWKNSLNFRSSSIRSASVAENVRRIQQQKKENGSLNLFLSQKLFHSVQILSPHCSWTQACKKPWRCTQAKIADWQAVWPFRTLHVCLGSSLGSPCFITHSICHWFNLASLHQTPTGPDPRIREARSRVTRSMTSSCLFTIGWWSVTSRLIDR